MIDGIPAPGPLFLPKGNLLFWGPGGCWWFWWPFRRSPGRHLPVGFFDHPGLGDGIFHVKNNWKTTDMMKSDETGPFIGDWKFWLALWVVRSKPQMVGTKTKGAAMPFPSWKGDGWAMGGCFDLPFLPVVGGPLVPRWWSRSWVQYG